MPLWRKCEPRPTSTSFPPFEENLSRRENVRWVYAVLFEQALSGWSTDERQWPTGRSLKLFEEWFDVEVFELIEDLTLES